ncbi:hypothetical protein A3I42_04840 [Candidatus Uhrbacteria bacterium RIFCSPLOWO2_02_FULL_49_11]|uniref:B3/B4 tRNA-binding domain-containing protein n=1 Tax=Candidatus Uhrbacteria bacterium RIFCSPLOWO2_02_FULL_49_11 TaxID=1802409 RepID=A0A1F7VB35_9BACT|nr:MAG: hypothetical protein A3I42_04840 [Candidatus Uhrbacteria bacterium RIFCSPLOWO2_02_FULL_49_11]
MKFVIDQKIFGKFPNLTVGIIAVQGIHNTEENAEVIDLLHQEERAVRERITIETLATHPKVMAWQEAYRAFGAKPKDHLSSVENLYRRVLGGAALRHINTFVDMYNYVSLKYMLPVGGEDLEKIKGDIQLTFAGPDGPPVLLLGDKDPRPPKEGEVIYRDGLGAICRRFNWREADRTKLTEETKNAVLVIEGLPPVSRNEIMGAVDELKNLIDHHCGGEASLFILDASNPTASW